MALEDKLAAQLRIDEDERPCAYRDHLGFLTIGVGRLIDSRKPGAGLRKVEMEFMLQNDIHERYGALSRTLDWFKRLDEARQGVLLNMSFQLGVDGLLAFKTTLSHVRIGDYDAAATAMLDSRWAKQTPNRAAKMAEQMRTGVWQ